MLPKAAPKSLVSPAHGQVNDLAKRSSVKGLPDEVRRQLDERLVGGQFSDYEGLSKWLEDSGYKIGKSSIHRYGQELEEQHDEAMSDARALLALTRAAGDIGDVGSELARSASTILQTDIVRTVLDIRKEEDPGKRAVLLSKLTKAQADIGRMSIAAEKWQAELTKKAQAAAASVEKVVKKAGLTAETADLIRKQILGIAG
jgi:hypothetical protein